MNVGLIADRCIHENNDGVKIPLNGTLKEFQRRNIDIDFFYEGNKGIEISNGILFRIYNSLRLNPFYERKVIVNCNLNRYDLLIISPRALLSIQNDLKNHAKKLAYINDVWGLVREKRTKFNWRLFNSLFLNYLAYVEKKRLEQYDLVAVQTNKEVDFLVNEYNIDPNKVLKLSNSVDQSLYEIEVNPEKGILFIGGKKGQNQLSSEYACDFFVKYFESIPFEIKFVGTGQALVKDLLQKDNISYVDYFENKIDLYKDSGILIAPVFKGYGLINKVIESMASGIIVIGDKTAFQGIEGFKDGLHGFIFDGKENLFQTLKYIESQSPEEIINMKLEARELIKSQFSWEKNVDKILERVTFS